MAYQEIFDEIAEELDKLRIQKFTGETKVSLELSLNHGGIRSAGIVYGPTKRIIPLPKRG